MPLPSGHEYPTLVPSPPLTPEVAQKPTTHPYRTSFIVAGVALLLLISLVAVRIGVSGSNMANNWTGAGGVFFTGGRTQNTQERLSAQETIKMQSPQTELGYIPIAAPSADNFQGDTSGDLGKLLSLLSAPQATSSTDISGTISGSYSLIPQGIISVRSTVQQRTKEAEALFAYGNEVGTYIQGFDATHGAAYQILKDQAEDRTNPDKNAALKALGQDFAQLGYDLTVMGTVPIPDDVKKAHTNYATAYRLVGTNLIHVAAANNDQDYLDAISKYNDSVDTLTKQYLNLVAIFGAQEVQFSSSDTGGIFMFNQNVGFGP